MPLSMSRPWKHPNSGMYWFRKAVPADLRALVGKREEKKSLQTKDPSIAKQRHVQALAEVEARWANLRRGQRLLSEQETHRLAVQWHGRWLETHQNNPSQQDWPTVLADRMWLPPAPLKFAADGSVVLEFDPADTAISHMQNWCRAKAVETLAEQGLIADDAGQLQLAKAISYAVQRASLTLAEYAKGNYGLQFASPLRQAKAAGASAKPLSFNDLLKSWAAERKPQQKTVYEWTRVLRQFAEFLGHDDATRISSDDVIRWKDAMVQSGLRSRTIQNSKLAPVRAILQWGADNRRIDGNPAERVSIEVRTLANERKRSFTDEEAITVLDAAKVEKDPVRRWVPWLGAYTGARVSELCQLRREDILQIDGIWCMKMDPEAGSLKTSSSERVIPLHPALIDNGFLSFVKSIRSGPLFAKLKPDKFGKRGGNGTKVIGRWVRSLGLVDPRLSPSHSWRHRIKTLGRRHGLAQDILEAITGHGRRTVADNYGEYPVEALYRELSKIPAVVLE
jgi:integrase